MTKQLLIYEDIVPVSKVDHREMSVRQTSDFGFASEINTAPIVDVEFAKVAATMPIVFAEAQTGLVPCALLGAANDTNSFVAKDGEWTGGYVPAFFRRYPFVFATLEESETLTLCLDKSYAGLNEDGEGERLFDSAGTETGYTRGVLRFVEEYQATFARTQALCDRLDALGLFEEARIDYTLADGSQGGVTGFKRVSGEKLRALPDEKIVELFRSGDLDLIQVHLMSLLQIESLVERLADVVTAESDAGEELSAPEKKKLN